MIRSAVPVVSFTNRTFPKSFRRQWHGRRRCPRLRRSRYSASGMPTIALTLPPAAAGPIFLKLIFCIKSVVSFRSAAIVEVATAAAYELGKRNVINAKEAPHLRFTSRQSSWCSVISFLLLDVLGCNTLQPRPATS